MCVDKNRINIIKNYSEHINHSGEPETKLMKIIFLYH